MKAALALALCAGKQRGGSCRVVDVLAERRAVDLRWRCGDETVADDNDDLAGRGSPSAIFRDEKHQCGMAPD